MDDKTKFSHIYTITNNKEGENITHKMTKLIKIKHGGNNLQLYIATQYNTNNSWNKNYIYLNK